MNTTSHRVYQTGQGRERGSEREEAANDLGRLRIKLGGTEPELDVDEDDRLILCCCEARHSFCCASASAYYCGSFPRHNILPISSSHSPGYRSALEAEAVEFLAV